MSKQNRQHWTTVVSPLVWGLVLCFSSMGMAQDRSRIVLETQAPQRVSLTVGKSMLVNSLKPITRISVADPEVVDPVVISPRQIYLAGKKVGTTNLTLWGEDDRVFSIVDIEVDPDLSRLQAMLQEILPGQTLRVAATREGVALFGEVSSPTHVSTALALAGAFAPKEKVVNLLQVAGVYQDPVGLSPFLLTQLKAKLREILPEENLQVTATHEGITLFGEVSSTLRLSQALAIAEAFAPGKVVNLLHVAGVHQVLLEVRIAEMSRSVTSRLGFNFAAMASGMTLGLSLLNSLTSLPGGVSLTEPPEMQLSSPSALNVSANINAIVRFQKGAVTWTGFIDALKENGLIKVLAEPTLVTLSGQEASFLAGGEFPVLIPQSLNAVTIQFKPFGVGLNFTPIVLSNKKISMKVTPEVSELDLSNPIVVAGFRIPAFNVRRASTVVELADGQSFAIAGLLHENVREAISRFPILGSIPVLGALFRSSSFQKSETELIIIVTPHLVKPLDLSKQPLPTDRFIEPNDAEFYLFGQLESRRVTKPYVGKLDGEFGYIYYPMRDTP